MVGTARRPGAFLVPLALPVPLSSRAIAGFAAPGALSIPHPRRLRQPHLHRRLLPARCCTPAPPAACSFFILSPSVDPVASCSRWKIRCRLLPAQLPHPPTVPPVTPDLCLVHGISSAGPRCRLELRLPARPVRVPLATTLPSGNCAPCSDRSGLRSGYRSRFPNWHGTGSRSAPVRLSLPATRSHAARAPSLCSAGIPNRSWCAPPFFLISTPGGVFSHTPRT